jgi:hypothetical protein
VLTMLVESSIYRLLTCSITWKTTFAGGGSTPRRLDSSSAKRSADGYVAGFPGMGLLCLERVGVGAVDSGRWSRNCAGWGRGMGLWMAGVPGTDA